MESPITLSNDPSSSPMPTLTENSKPGRRRRNTSVPSATNNPPTTRKRGARCSNKPKPTFQCSACSAIFKRSEHLVRHYRSRTYCLFVFLLKFTNVFFFIRHPRTPFWLHLLWYLFYSQRFTRPTPTYLQRRPIASPEKISPRSH